MVSSMHWLLCPVVVFECEGFVDADLVWMLCTRNKYLASERILFLFIQHSSDP
jgi:hypothetical protein